MVRRASLGALARWLGVAATCGMFVVLVMGATVTNTGSEHGCGRSWPLCHGQFIPQMAVSTMIEFSHRAVVGVESVLIIGLAILAAAAHWKRAEVRFLASLMVVFLFLQAGLGAWAVMQPQSAAALALHFGVSLIAFASVLLMTVLLFEIDGREVLRTRLLDYQYRALVWAVTGYSYAVVYLGAYVRHSDADQACTGWPLCNGAVIPRFHDKVGAVFIHRTAAALLVFAILGLFVWSWRMRASRPDLLLGSAFALLFVMLQALSGALVVWTRMDLFSALAHAALVALMFGSLTYVCMHVTPPRILPVRQGDPSISRTGTRQEPAGASR
jgi:heme a synthase